MALAFVIQSYRVRGFTVVQRLVDIQFEALENEFDGVDGNTVSRGEHVPEIERFIRVLKERYRCYFAMVPFPKLPTVMVQELVLTVTFYINIFQWEGGLDHRLSPCNIVQHKHVNFNLHFKTKFVSLMITKSNFILY